MLIDVNDVGLGYRTKQTWNVPGEWVWSDHRAHEPLIDDETFKQAQGLRRAKDSTDERSPRRMPRPYALRGIVRCGLCERKMLPQLDAWLSELFSPGALPQTVRDLEAAQPDEPRPDEAAQREIAECDAKLKQHRAALEAGADA